ncbi:MAG: hypothetical protein MUC38_07385 [Cyclobacteriaceae bacterium]|jgi:hypothetical protein|nr:hypothetical protein [Cyclobacteriaceae bacterium]
MHRVSFPKKLLWLLVCSGLAWPACAQSPIEKKWTASWKTAQALPDKLLAGRSVVLHGPSLTREELQTAQTVFQQTGIDAVGYFETDQVFAGTDAQRSFANYFNRRQISFLIALTKSEKGYLISIVPYNRKPGLTEEGVAAWQVRSASWREALMVLYTTAARALKRENFLVNDLPEQDLRVGVVRGDRQEICYPNIRLARIAVPRFDAPAQNDSLEVFLKMHFPVKYELVDGQWSDRELLDRGFTFVLRHFYTRGSLIKELLQYEVKTETAFATATYPQGQLMLKPIPARAYVYKFYLKELEYGNLYLGSRWDADLTWPEALLNHIRLYQADRRL